MGAEIQQARLKLTSQPIIKTIPHTVALGRQSISIKFTVSSTVTTLSVRALFFQILQIN